MLAERTRKAPVGYEQDTHSFWLPSFSAGGSFGQSEQSVRRGVSIPARGVELLNPHDDSQLPNGPDKVLLGTSRQRVQDFDAVRGQEFYDSPKLPNSQLWDGGVLENEKDDVASLDFSIVDPFWFRYEQV